MTSQYKNKAVIKIVKKYRFELWSTPIIFLDFMLSLDVAIEKGTCLFNNTVWIWFTLINIFVP